MGRSSPRPAGSGRSSPAPSQVGKHPGADADPGDRHVLGRRPPGHPRRLQGDHRRLHPEGVRDSPGHKPGCGDSEGGPASEVNFDTELDGYRQGLKVLQGPDNVNASNVYIFGHSMGGVMAPLLGPDVPVRGIIAYGGIARSWAEYVPENFRRQAELAVRPTPPSTARRRKRGPDDPPVRQQPGAEAGRREVPRTPGAARAVVPRRRDPRRSSTAFFRQLANKNLGEAWESFGATPWPSGAGPTTSRTRMTTP